MMTLTRSKKAQGAIKQLPEDFVVQEITKEGVVIEASRHYAGNELGMKSEAGKFAVFVLQKREWNTVQAVRAVAKKFRRGMRSAGFAGTKDRMSVSTQLCSIYGIDHAGLESVHIKDLQINGAWQSSTGIKLGMLSGNRFAVRVRGLDEAGYGMVSESLAELNQYGLFPNYFGEQRFGSRDNNFAIGLAMLKGDFETAAMLYLTDAGNELSVEAVEARQRLAEERDFKKALAYFPKYLKYERLMIEYLSAYPGNYANALRRLPRTLSLMFIHSVEDAIFNEELEQRIEAGEIRPSSGDLVCRPGGVFYDIASTEPFDGTEAKGLLPVANILGYDSKPNDFEKEALERHGLKLEDFKLAGMPELNCKGAYRALFAPYKGVEARYEAADNSAVLSFSLPAGSYATVFLNELLAQRSAT
ncbi:MAG: tRNA pseudouridine(13) synthase TruD [Candidatus Micrarchaeia archaeon]